MKCIFVILLVVIQSLALAQKPSIGIFQDLEKDSMLRAAGYGYLAESVARCFSPRNVSDLQFQEKLQAIKKIKIKLYACNLFLPAEIKVVGPTVDETAILSYAEVVMKRTQAAGVKLILWGSGGSRNVPEGFDRASAKSQFISIAKKVAVLAKKYELMIALKNLNSSETNFITTVEEAYEIIQQVDHPRFRLCVDLYHMMKEKEQPIVLEKAGVYIVECNLAEQENRNPPGTKGDDFRPYLRALKKINYHGKITMECRWSDVSAQAGPAYNSLKGQIDDAWDKN